MIPVSTRQDTLISIPAFREEGDRPVVSAGHGLREISIPAFREEGDIKSIKPEFGYIDFNPRLP